MFKAVIDKEGIESQIGQMDDGMGGTTYVIECAPRADSGNHLKINCCFTANSPVLLLVPQMAMINDEKRADVLELCNYLTYHRASPGGFGVGFH